MTPSWETLLGIQHDWALVKRIWTGTWWTRGPTIVYYLCKYGTLIALVGM